jgi:tetratricopeptide (TPR) repeat protein
MADNRKDFRPRRLAFGGRLFPRACGFAAVFAICVAVGPASAEDAGLKNGAASLSAGKYDAAVRQLSSTINSDNTAPADAAKALYLRGLAYRKMGESARAIADLGAAIWLGLPEPDKVKAFVNRGLAYKSAGLSREGDAEFAAARKVGGSAADTLIAEGGGVGHIGLRRAAAKRREQRQPSHTVVRFRDRFLILIRTCAAFRTGAGAAGCASAAQTGGATALSRRGEFELVHDD